VGQEARRQKTDRYPNPNEDVTVVKSLKSEKGQPDRRAKSKDRRGEDRRVKSIPAAVEHRQLERRAKVNRRRQIDPTTCERDYSTDEIEFMHALEKYKRASGRMFPTCSEILEVVRGLGYQKSSTGSDDRRPLETGTFETSEPLSAIIIDESAAVA
jgi:hypothetical protein